jgi:UDP-glucose 4-epimerase
MRNSIIYVTGGAGFIGSNLCDHLVKKNYNVIALDNLKTGKLFFLKNLKNKKNFKFINIDLKNKNKLTQLIKKNSIVFHLSANADVRNGINNRYIDLKENVIVTHNVLEACIKNNVKKIIFSSTGSVYGEAKQIPTVEDNNYPIQTSLYANSKNCCEGLITTYSKYFGIKYSIFRFVSVLGPRYTHGHVIDFYRNLLKDRLTLKIIGNGLQKKSYMHVDDCCRALLMSIKNKKFDNQILNLGSKEWITINKSIKIICNKLNLNPKIVRQKNKKSGWPGDNPKIFLSTKKINKLGWSAKKSIKISIQETIDYLIKNLKYMK